MSAPEYIPGMKFHLRFIPFHLGGDRADDRGHPSGLKVPTLRSLNYSLNLNYDVGFQ